MEPAAGIEPATCGDYLSLPSSKYDANVVLAGGNERNIVATYQRRAIQLGHRHATSRMARILNCNVIERRMIPETNRIPRPVARNARIDGEGGTAQAEAEHPFDTGSIEPARRTAIPGPSPAAGMRRVAIHVTGYDVWLDLVTLDLRSRRDTMNGLSMRNNSPALSPSPIATNANTVQTAAWVYWPPFSRMPGT